MEVLILIICINFGFNLILSNKSFESLKFHFIQKTSPCGVTRISAISLVIEPKQKVSFANEVVSTHMRPHDGQDRNIDAVRHLVAQLFMNTVNGISNLTLV